MGLINKSSFLKTLGYLSPGLSTKDLVEQSSCFVFRNKEAVTFNSEVACRFPCDVFGENEVAIPSKLVDVLTKIPDDGINLELKDSELIITGKRRRVGLRVEQEILMPIESIEHPKDWKKLPDEFGEAIGTVYLCASRGDGNQTLACVNITPDYIQARDDCQACRWKMKTGFDSPCLVRQHAIKHVAPLGMTWFCQTNDWVHFKNEQGLIYSCRQWKSDDYPSLEKIFSPDGNFTKGGLPKSLGEVCERAELFSTGNSGEDVNRIEIKLKAGRAKLRGEGLMGWYEEIKKVAYNGKPMTFYMNPKILSSIVKKHSDVNLADDRMRVNGGNHVYVTSLMVQRKEPVENKDEE